MWAKFFAKGLKIIGKSRSRTSNHIPYECRFILFPPPFSTIHFCVSPMCLQNQHFINKQRQEFELNWFLKSHNLLKSRYHFTMTLEQLVISQKNLLTNRDSTKIKGLHLKTLSVYILLTRYYFSFKKSLFDLNP